MNNVVATQNYREVSRKAAVGERIKIVKPLMARGYGLGDEFTVIRVDSDGSGDVRVPKEGRSDLRFIAYTEYVVLEPIAEPVAQPSALTSDPLYAAFRQFVADNSADLRKLLDGIDRAMFGASVPEVFAPTPPMLTRAQVIAKATADVAELLAQNYTLSKGYRPSAYFSTDGGCSITDECNFVVNREKRTVVALISVIGSGCTDRKGIAKCSPADVFHAEIGKAIALRKALGLTVPSEYTDAPQPERAYAGAKIGVKVIRDGARQNVFTVSKERVGYLDHLCEEYVNETLPLCGRTATILDDTDVDYTSAA